MGALPLSPGKCEKVHIDFALPAGDENYIRFEFKRLGDCKWAKDGFSEGSVQFKLPDRPYHGTRGTEEYETDDGQQEFVRFDMADGVDEGFAGDISGATDNTAHNAADNTAARSGAPKTAENDGKTVVSGKDFRYVFSTLSGSFETLEHRGKPVCSSPLKLKIFCKERLLPAFCSAELSVDGELAVIRSEMVYMAEGQSGKQSFVAVWCVDKKGKITLDCSVPSGDFETDGIGLDFDFENTDFIYFGKGEKSGYTGIFRTNGDSRRLIRCCLFDRIKRPICVFCSDRMTVETKNGMATFSAGLSDGERGLCELSLCICPDREGRLLFE